MLSGAALLVIFAVIVELGFPHFIAITAVVLYVGYWSVVSMRLEASMPPLRAATRWEQVVLIASSLLTLAGFGIIAWMVRVNKEHAFDPWWWLLVVLLFVFE